MNPSKLELSVGTFVLFGLVALSVFALKSGADRLLPARSYPVTARFTNVGGLKAGSPVFIAGVSVGQVTTVALGDHYSAFVEMRLRREVRLPADTIASVKTLGLVGTKIITLLPGADERMIPDGGAITDTESAIDVESLISRFAFGNAKKPDDEK